jgi:pimeloyl-ACP methyl ester carboxylesterase
VTNRISQRGSFEFQRALHRQALPHADWVVLDGVGHSPQLDVPLDAA